MIDELTFPRRARGPIPKPSRTARKVSERRTRLDRQKTEKTEKAKVRRRDRGCRFPLCGCRKLGLKLDARPEVSHDQAKGMGGNPRGDRSTAAGMVQLCLHRHQDGIISRHKGTLRVQYLTGFAADGPLAWEIDVRELPAPFLDVLREVAPFRWRGSPWLEIARESAVQVWTVNHWQKRILDFLAEMSV